MATRIIFHSPPSSLEEKMKSILDSLGLEYEYQMPVRSGFVIDFAFPKIMKAIEVDGYYHQFSRGRDMFRDAILKRAGWNILRVSAKELDNPNIQGVVKEFLDKS